MGALVRNASAIVAMTAIMALRIALCTRVAGEHVRVDHMQSIMSGTYECKSAMSNIDMTQRKADSPHLTE